MSHSGNNPMLSEGLSPKLHAGNITPWHLAFTDGKGTLTLGPLTLGTEAQDGLLLLQGKRSMDWDEYLAVVHPADRPALAESARKLLTDPSLPYQMEYRVWDEKAKQWHWLFSFGTTDWASENGQSGQLSGGVQTIQAKKDAQRQREHEHSFNSALVEGLPGPYLVADKQGRITRWNRHFEDAFIVDGQQPGSMLWTDIFLPQERSVANEAAAGVKQCESRSFRAHTLLKDGTRRLFFCQIRFFSEGDDTHMLALLFDLSEAEQAENRLEQATSSLETVVSAANLGTWDWNLVTGKVYYNQTWADIAGLKLEDIQGSVDAWEKSLLPEDLHKAMEAVDAHVRGETPGYEAEFRMVRPDGTIIWAVDRGRVVEKDEDGGVVRLLGVLQDITNEKERQFELTRNKNHLEMLMRETHFGAWDWNLVKDTIEYNESYFSIMGYEPGEVDPSFEFWSSLIHPDDLKKTNDALDDLIKGRTSSYECEVRMRHKNGHYVWTYDTGHPVEWDEDGNITRVVGGHFDIDKRKQQAEAQAEALRTIATQKAVLEQAFSERTTLLEEARKRIAEVLRATGQAGQATDLAADLAADLTPGLATGLTTGLASGQATGQATGLTTGLTEETKGLALGEEAGGFAENLRRVVDLIMSTMWWYKAVIDSLPFPIFVTDMDDRWTYLNSPALRTIGAEELSQVRGQPARAWGEDRNASGIADTKLSVKNQPGFINRYNPRLGCFFQGQASYLSDQSGKRIGHIEAVQDVTEMHAANQRTHIMLDAMPLACAFWKSDITMADCNLAAPRLFGFAGKKEFRRDFFSLMPEDMFGGKYGAEKAKKLLLQTFKDGYRRQEWIYRLPDGRFMPAEITLVRVTFGDDLIVLAYIRDLTELKTKEQELDKERQLLAKIMDSSPVCFIIVVDGLIRFATPYAMEFFGIQLESRADACFAAADEGRAFFDEVSRQGMVNWRVVSMHSGKNGTREMLANAFEAEYFGKPCVMSWFLDVTEMRETERQLRLARDAAEESTRAKSDFLANMSHEIRTPMNAILGMTRLVLDTSLSPRQRGHLEKAEQAVRSLLRILNDILDFSKIEAGRLEMESTAFSLRDVLQGVMDMFRESVAAQNLTLSLHEGHAGRAFGRSFTPAPNSHQPCGQRHQVYQRRQR